MSSGFDRAARVVSGTTPSPSTVQAYRVVVDAGRLRLVPADRPGVVLDVGLDRVRVRPLGRAGAALVEVDGSPVVVDFTERDDGAGGAAATVARVLRGVRARRTRGTFLAVTGRSAR